MNSIKLIHYITNNSNGFEILFNIKYLMRETVSNQKNVVNFLKLQMNLKLDLYTQLNWDSNEIV